MLLALQLSLFALWPMLVQLISSTGETFAKKWINRPLKAFVDFVSFMSFLKDL